MKSIIINPPINKNIYSEYSFSAPIIPSIGLLSIAAIMKEKDCKTIFLDAIPDKKKLSEIIQTIKEESPDLICLTASTATWNSAKEVIQKSKSFKNNLITIIGGSHISANPEKSMKECKDLDIGVIGEGELTIKEILENLKNKKSLKYVKGIIYRKENKLIKTENRELINDLDQLPIPSFEFAGSIKKYFHNPLRVKNKFFPLVTSRGCNYNCSFCDQSVFGRKWRSNSPKRVIEMIQKVKSLYDVRFISFEDDNFGVDTNRVIKICKLIIKNNIRIQWGCSMHINSINEKMLKWMKQAGCWIIYTGIESGSQRILDEINKKTNIQKIEKKIKLIKKNKIKVYGSFIIGFPDETKEEIEKTKKLALKLPLDGVSFFIYTQFPKESVKNKQSKEWDRFSTHNANPIVINKNLSKKYLLAKQREFYKKFYLRPSYIIKQLSKITDYNLLKKTIQYLKNQTKLFYTSYNNS